MTAARDELDLIAEDTARLRASFISRAFRWLFAFFLFLPAYAHAINGTQYVDTGTGCGSNDGSIGNPYCSCTEWEAQNGTLDGNLTVLFTGTDTARCVIDGWTTTGQRLTLSGITIATSDYNSALEISDDNITVYAGSISKNAAGLGIDLIYIHDATGLIIDRMTLFHGASLTKDGGLGCVRSPGAAGTLTIRNSILYNCIDYALVLGIGPSQTISIYNNTIVGSRGGAGTGINLQVDSGSSSTLNLRNNLVVDSDVIDYDISEGANTYNHSANIASDTSSDDDSFDSKTITFVDAGTNDYHLDPAETDAIDLGTDLTGSGVTEDIDGDTRPQGSATDIGADEVAAADPVELDPADFIAEDFKLWWDNPIRAHTGVPIDHRYSVYEIDNRPLTWEIANAPVGMTISTNGTVSWASPSAGTYTDIVVTVSRTECDTATYPSCVLEIENTFTLVVGTADFIFVATTGNDTTGTGAIGAPYATIYKAMDQITGNDGKTIYVRAGTYDETWDWENGGNNAPFETQNFTAADYMLVRSYPGEAAIHEADGGHGFWDFNAQYVVFSNFTTQNATLRAGVLLEGTHTILKDAVVHSTEFSAGDNVTGILIRGNDTLTDRVVAYDNDDTGASLNTNESNWLLYNTVAGSTKWVLNSKGWGSTRNIKVKHCSQPDTKAIIHNSESFGVWHAFGASCAGTSFRYGVAYDSEIFRGTTDPSSSNHVGLMFFDHISQVGASAGGGFTIQTDYGSDTLPTFLRRSIFYQANGAGTTGDGTRQMMNLWRYTASATARAYAFDSDYNLFHNTSGYANGWYVGNTTPLAALADYQALTGDYVVRDPNSSTGNPGFTSVGTGDLTIAVASLADTACGTGEYCGAFRPGQAYGAVGSETTTLLEFIDFADEPGGGGGSINPTNPFFQLLRRRRR